MLRPVEKWTKWVWLPFDLLAELDSVFILFSPLKLILETQKCLLPYLKVLQLRAVCAVFQEPLEGGLPCSRRCPLHCSLLTLATSWPGRAGGQRETSRLVSPPPKNVCSFRQAASNETKLLEGCFLGTEQFCSLSASHLPRVLRGNNCWGPGEASNDGYFLAVLPPVYVNIYLCSEYVVHWMFFF